MVKDDRIALRVKSELRAALESAAEAEGRTLANMVERILQQWVDANAKKR